MPDELSTRTSKSIPASEKKFQGIARKDTHIRRPDLIGPGRELGGIAQQTVTGLTADASCRVLHSADIEARIGRVGGRWLALP